MKKFLNWQKFPQYSYIQSLGTNLTIRMCNIFSFAMYSPIWGNAMAYYSITDPSTMQWFTNIQFLCPLIFCIAAVYINNYRNAIWFASFLSMLGAWIIYLAGQNFLLASLGAGIITLAEPFFMTDIPKRYFGEYEQTISTFLCLCIFIFGIGFSYTIVAYMFYNVTDQNLINDMIDEMNFYDALANTIMLPLIILAIHKKTEGGRMFSLKLAIHQLFQREENLLDTLAFSIYIGLSWSYLTFIGIDLGMLGYTVIQGANIGIIFQSCGSITIIFIAIVLDGSAKQGKIPNYDKYINFLSTIGFVFLINLALIDQYLSYELLCLFHIVLGMGLNSLYPVFVLAIIEKLSPIDPMFLLLLLFFISNFIGFIIGYILTVPILLQYCLWVFLFLMTPTQLYLIIFYRTKYRRFDSAIL